MNSYFKLTSAVLALSGWLNTAQATTYAYQTLDVPGLPGTLLSQYGGIPALSINNLGAILTPTGVIDPDGTFISVNGGVAINDSGEVVGANFLFSGGVYTPIPSFSPGPSEAPYDTQAATGINNAGQIVGYAGYSAFCCHYFAFLYDNGTFGLIGPDILGKLAIAGPPRVSINNLGQVLVFSAEVGLVVDRDGVLTPIVVPNLPNLIEGPFPAGIDDMGRIVGNFLMPGEIEGALGLVENDHGFVYANGQTSIITVPGAIQTLATGINDAGEIVGAYTDSNGHVHGFVATVVPEPGSLVLFGVASAILIALRIRRKLPHPSRRQAPMRPPESAPLA